MHDGFVQAAWNEAARHYPHPWIDVDLKHFTDLLSTFLAR